MVRVEPVTETGLRTGTFVAKWKRIGPARINIQKTGSVFAGLPFNAGQRIPLRFGLNGRDSLTVSEQKVICLAAFQQSFAYGDSQSSGEIGLGAVLNNPAGLLKE